VTRERGERAHAYLPIMERARGWSTDRTPRDPTTQDEV
jgi:hypothetical protein